MDAEENFVLLINFVGDFFPNIVVVAIPGLVQGHKVDGVDGVVVDPHSE